VTVPAADIVIAARAAAYKLELEHCDAHFDKVLPVAAKLYPAHRCSRVFHSSS
jgi:predicted nucleic acid-binding protein